MQTTKLDLRGLRLRVADALSTLRHSCGTLSDMQRLMKPIHDEISSRTPANKRRYPVYFGGYVMGLEDIEYHRIMKDEVEFCYRLKKGKTLYSSWAGSTHRTTESLALEYPDYDLNDCEAAHVWKGSEKAFDNWERVEKSITPP